ncbi:MAG: T9SS type A sorting domain-containing protein, partial [Bacteroidota bacterium]
TQNQYLFNFPFVGTFDLTMRAVSGGCEDFLTKSIVVYADSTTIPSPFEVQPELLQFALTPNPNNGIFEVTVELSEVKPIVLSIFNAAGVEVDRRILTGQALYEEAYSPGLTSGIYICALQTPTQRKSILFTVAVP